MKTLKNTKFLVITALLTSLACVLTMAVKIPTPTFGYVHPGDCIVLLCGLVLGPVYGALAAGIGSAMADLLSGYAIWVPGTFVIKAVTALIAALVFRFLRKLLKDKAEFGAAITAGIGGEAFMVIGYFFYNIIVISFTNAAFNSAGLAAAITESAAEIPYNIFQGGVGIVLSALIFPVLRLVPEIRGWMKE